MPMTSCSSYLASIYNPKKLKWVIGRLARHIRAVHKAGPIDAIACRGSSGMAVAFPLSAMLGIPVVNIRKEKEDSHGKPVEGPDGVIVKRYVIVDDLIASGGTVRAIMDGLWSAKCAAIFLYQGRYYSGTDTLAGVRVVYVGAD